MKQLMLGNKALARGLYEAGCSVVSSYPGTPSTEVTEEAQNMMRFTVNGHRMKRLRWKLHLVHLLLEREVFAE